MKPSLSTMLVIDVFPQIFLIFSFSPRTILHCSIEWEKGKVMALRYAFSFEISYFASSFSSLFEIP